MMTKTTLHGTYFSNYFGYEVHTLFELLWLDEENLLFHVVSAELQHIMQHSFSVVYCRFRADRFVWYLNAIVDRSVGM